MKYCDKVKYLDKIIGFLNVIVAVFFVILILFLPLAVSFPIIAIIIFCIRSVQNYLDDRDYKKWKKSNNEIFNQEKDK